MRIEDEFRVSAPVDEAWALLLDIERIAPCLPGAQLQEVVDDEYRGVVKVKVGPISAQYRGSARLDAVDEGERSAVIRAVGRDTRGAGNASATISASMRPDGDATVVSLGTDLAITGKVAQLGRGVLADVSAKLLGEFAANLERDVLRAGAAAPGGATTASPDTGDPQSNGGVRRIDAPEAEPVDLVDAAGAPVARRAVPVLVGAAVVVVAWRWRRRRRARRLAPED